MAHCGALWPAETGTHDLSCLAGIAHLGCAVLSGELPPLLLLLLTTADAEASGLPTADAVPASCCRSLLSSACCSRLPTGKAVCLLLLLS